MNVKTIISTIATLVTRSKPQIKETTSIGTINANLLTLSPEIEQFRLNNTRIGIINDCRTMYNERGQIFAIIQTIAAYLNKGGYVVQVNKKEAKITPEEQKAQEVLNAVNERLQLQQLMAGWMIPLIRDGVLPVEIEIADNQIVRATKLAAEITYQRMDARGRSYRMGGAVNPDNAYWQGALYSYGAGEVCHFADWQIMWIEWNPIQGEQGLPQFYSARKLYKRLEKAEESQSISRTTKSGYKLHHKIGTADNPSDPEAIEKYKQMNRDVLGKALAVAKDYFSNGLVEIKEISGDSRQISIVDIQYQQAQLFGVGGVPLAIMPGQEGSIIRDSSNESIKGFISWIKTCNTMIGLELKRSIFDLELLLNGINPESISYDIIWGEKLDNGNELAEKAEIREGKSAGLMSVETAMQKYGIKDIEVEKERIKKDIAEFPTVPVARGTAYSVGDNPLGLVGGLKLQERRLEHEERLINIVAMNEIAKRIRTNG